MEKQYDIKHLLKVAEAANNFQNSFDRFRYVVDNSVGDPDDVRSAKIAEAQKSLNNSAELFNAFLMPNKVELNNQNMLDQSSLNNQNMLPKVELCNQNYFRKH